MAPRAILKSRLSNAVRARITNIAEWAVYLVTDSSTGIHGGTR